MDVIALNRCKGYHNILDEGRTTRRTRKGRSHAENCRDGPICFTESGDRYVAFSVTNSLDQAVFNVPLTVRIDTSHALETASAILAGTELPTQVRGQRILVDVVPGREQVRVTWQ